MMMNSSVHETSSDMSDKNHLGQTNTFATQDRWSVENFGLISAEKVSVRLKYDLSDKPSDSV